VGLFVAGFSGPLGQFCYVSSASSIMFDVRNGSETQAYRLKFKVVDMLDMMSQSDIAKKLDISQSQVSRIAKIKMTY